MGVVYAEIYANIKINCPETKLLGKTEPAMTACSEANEDGHIENADKIDHHGVRRTDSPSQPTITSVIITANRFVGFGPYSFRS